MHCTWDKCPTGLTTSRVCPKKNRNIPYILIMVKALSKNKSWQPLHSQYGQSVCPKIKSDSSYILNMVKASVQKQGVRGPTFSIWSNRLSKNKSWQILHSQYGQSFCPKTNRDSPYILNMVKASVQKQIVTAPTFSIWSLQQLKIT